MSCIYVIRTFVRTGRTIGALSPTICFERDLALEMAQSDKPEAEGVAVYELNGETLKDAKAKPFASFGVIPDAYWRIGRDELLAAAPVRETAAVG